jgi:hypothetical protein
MASHSGERAASVAPRTWWVFAVAGVLVVAGAAAWAVHEVSMGNGEAQCQQDEKPHLLPTASSLIGFDEALRERSALVDAYVVRNLCWYRLHADAAMWRSRMVAAAIVVLAALIPLLAGLSDRWKTKVLPVVSVAVAALTGINATFQWQQQWQGFRQAELALESEILTWRVALMKAREATDAAGAIRAASEATDELIREAAAIVAKETGTYFETVAKPGPQTAQ